MQDFYNPIIGVSLVDPGVAVAADQQSDYIDLAGYEGVTLFIISKMGTADGSNYVTPILQEADASPASSGSYSAVAASDLLGTLSARNALTHVIEHVSYIGDKRYLNILLDETGTASGNFAVVAVLHKARHQPAADDSPTTGTVS